MSRTVNWGGTGGRGKVRSGAIRPALLLAATVCGLSYSGSLPCAAKPSANPARDALEKPLPPKVDLRVQMRRWQLQPAHQGTRNTCSVFTTVWALEFALARHNGRGTTLSVEYLNWACNQVIGNKTADRGQFFHDLLRGFERFGICTAKTLPYQARFDPKLAPSPEAGKEAGKLGASGLRIHWITRWKPRQGLSDERLRRIKAVLAAGYPVAAGSNHSRLLVGYEDDPAQDGGGTFITKDSGSGSYGTVSYRWAQDRLADTFWVEAPPAQPKTPTVPPALDSGRRDPASNAKPVPSG